MGIRRETRDGLKERFPMGSPPPTGYVAWHDWAHAQHLHGLRQSCCPRCGLFKYPQEMASHYNLQGAPCKQS